MIETQPTSQRDKNPLSIADVNVCTIAKACFQQGWGLEVRFGLLTGH